MKVNYYKLLKISNETGAAAIANFDFLDNIHNYVMSILVKTANANIERKYKFNKHLNTTQEQIRNLITTEGEKKKKE